VIGFVLVPYLEKPFVRIGKTSVVFLPYYLDGSHPIFHSTYYDILIGMDLTVFPSYYEPWGYTPLESVAFGVPTITTSLSGFGAWYKAQQSQEIPFVANSACMEPVTVVERNDSNYSQVVRTIASTMQTFLELSPKQIAALRKSAAAVGKEADWEHFFPYYEQAYDIALKKR